MNISYFTTYPLLFISFIVICFFIYALIRSGNSVKIDPQDANETQGEIINIRSSSGGNSAFINVVIQVRFATTDNKIVTSEGSAVIDIVKIPQYQKGTKVPLIYSKKDPKIIKLKILSPLEERMRKQ